MEDVQKTNFLDWILLLSASSRLHLTSKRSKYWLSYSSCIYSLRCFSTLIFHVCSACMHVKPLSLYTTPSCPLPAFLSHWKPLGCVTRLGFDRRLRLACVKMLMHREEMKDELWVCRTSSYHDFKRWSLRTLFSVVDMTQMNRNRSGCETLSL